jgi:hypothetical protein
MILVTSRLGDLKLKVTPFVRRALAKQSWPAKDDIHRSVFERVCREYDRLRTTDGDSVLTSCQRSPNLERHADDATGASFCCHVVHSMSQPSLIARKLRRLLLREMHRAFAALFLR